MLQKMNLLLSYGLKLQVIIVLISFVYAFPHFKKLDVQSFHFKIITILFKCLVAYIFC